MSDAVDRMLAEIVATPESIFQDMVGSLVKPGLDICREMDPRKAHLMHMAMGIAGEAGEILDAIKKHVIYNKPLDVDHVIEELGDSEFFMEGLRQELRIEREETLRANVKKLGVRYEAGSYSDTAAQTRADKA